MQKVDHYIYRIQNEKQPIRFLFSRLLWKTHLSQLFTIHRDSYTMRFFPTGLAAGLWANPDALRKEEIFMASYLREGDVVVDVGANIGTATLAAAAIVGNSGTVFSMEPHPVIFRYLQENVTVNDFKNVHLFNFAVGESKKIVSFSNKHLPAANRIISESDLKVHCNKLDDVLLPYKPETVDLLKIDVEGYEKYVFQGALEIMPRTKCVYFECVERYFANYNYNSSEVFDILRSLGFSLYKIKGGGENRLAIRDLPSFLERTGTEDITEI